MADPLEERLKRLEQDIQTIRDRHALENLMGRYGFYASSGQGERIVSELWASGDNISIEYGASGVYEGQWKIKTYYIKSRIPGCMETVSFFNPCIETGKGRGRGVWMALATQTDAGELGPAPPAADDNRRFLLSSRTRAGKSYRAEVLLQKYEVHFVMEEKEWKIQKLHVHEFFRCPFDQDWVTFARERFETDGIWLESLFETPMPLPEESHGENLPSGPTSRHWQYTTDGLPDIRAMFDEEDAALEQEYK